MDVCCRQTETGGTGSMMEQAKIIVIGGKEMARMAYELCTLAGLAEDIRSCAVKPEPLIAMKPNLVGPIPAGDGATTHPEIVEGVTAYLRDHGFQNLILMESSWVGDKTSDALLVTGFGALSKRLGIPFFDLQSDRSVPTDCAGMKIRICKKALEADYLINLPVMKGHCQTRMTCALKNLKGCIPNAEKRRFHSMGLHEPIGHLSAGLKQGFILAVAICPDLTFEDGGNPVQMDLMLCSYDPVLLDTYACSLVGVKPESVPYIRIAEQCGVGESSLSREMISCFLEKKTDEGITYVKTDQLPDPQGSHSRQILRVKERVCELDSCSACYGTLIPVLHRLEQEGLLEKLPHRLCIGQGYRGKTGSVGIGNCTAAFDVSLPGCPPTAEEMERFLRSIAGSLDV